MAQQISAHVGLQAAPSHRFVAVVVAVAVVSILTAAGTAVRGTDAFLGYAACDPSAVQFSGYIDIPGVNGTQKHYFYWLFGPRRWPADGSAPPVIMWLQGGPGCSSMLGLLTELGPCLMNETSGELYRNAYGWNDEAYLLFVDQTAGVGFSHADTMNYDHNESEAAEDMYNFLQGFARKFPSPSITGANDLYITGESYAGHYVPAFAHRVVVGNQRGDGPHINLKGIAVGNGWIDPYTQYPSYVDIAYDWCIEKTGAPCVNESVRDEMARRMPRCLELTAMCNVGVTDVDPVCVEAYNYCEDLAGLFSVEGKNTMDLRVQSIGDLGYPMEKTNAFLRSDEVRATLGVASATEWSTCNEAVGELFDHDEQRNFNWTIPPLLDAGVRVLIYAGDCDYICNWIGNKAWVKALQWSGTAGFNAAPDVEFHVGGRWAGQERAYGNFSFVRIYDAGHMVPMDQPEVSLYMLSRFLHDRRLSQ